jgi:hypothetical protein
MDLSVWYYSDEINDSNVLAFLLLILEVLVSILDQGTANLFEIFVVLFCPSASKQALGYVCFLRVGSIGGSCEHYYEFPSSINLRQFL